MKRPIQCVEQQVWPSNLTKYCACHGKWLSWLIRVTYEMSFTFCGASGITLQPRQILRLPRKMTRTINSSSWHMKRHWQCAEQQASPSNLTKYCACHEKWFASLILMTYQASFTMRRATGLTLQPHQILRLRQKMTRTIHPHDIWNVIYNARSNRHHPPITKYCACHTK